MDNTHYISPERVDFKKIKPILDGDVKLALSEEAKSRINKCRTYLDNKMKVGDRIIYGINTGFGSLYNKSIVDEDLGQLQENLVKSHACGTGKEVSHQVVKVMLF